MDITHFCIAIVVFNVLFYFVVGRALAKETAKLIEIADSYEKFGNAWITSSRYYRDMLHRIAPDHPEVVEDRKFTLLYRDGKIERVSTAELPQLLAESLENDDTKRA